MHPQLQRTWDQADVELALREALDVVEQLDPPEDLRALTMQYAATLCTQTAQRVGIPVSGAQLLGG